MTLPYQPEPDHVLAARFPVAMEASPWSDEDFAVVDAYWSGPAAIRRHVFDGADGLRVVVYRRSNGGGSVLCAVGVALPNTEVYRQIAGKKLTASEFAFMALTRMMRLGCEAKLRIDRITARGEVYLVDRSAPSEFCDEINCFAVPEGAVAARQRRVNGGGHGEKV